MYKTVYRIPYKLSRYRQEAKLSIG